MASENSEDGSAALSDASSYKCDTLSPESRVASPKVQINPDSIGKPSPRKSPRTSAAFGSYLNKAIAQGSRAFYGTDSEASDDEACCDKELIGKAAHALSEDINDRIRHRVGSCSPTSSKREPVAGESATGKEVHDPVSTDEAPSSAAKVDQGCNSSQPDCEDRSSQTASPGEEAGKIESNKRPDVAHTATQSSDAAPPAEITPPKPDDAHRPSANPELLKQRAIQLEERVRLLKERKSSSRMPSSIPGGSFVEQLKKIDLSLDGGTLKVCDRNLSENGEHFTIFMAMNSEVNCMCLNGHSWLVPE